MTLPILQTERLILRPFQRDDFDAYCTLMTSARAEHMGGPFSKETAWTYFTNDAAAHVLSGYGVYTIMTDGTPAGFCGVIQPPAFPEPELGWGVYDGFEGRGFATEAATAILRQMFAQTDHDSFVSYIAPENALSIAVAARVGGILDPSARVPEGWRSLVYRHTHPTVQVSA